MVFFTVEEIVFAFAENLSYTKRCVTKSYTVVFAPAPYMGSLAAGPISG